VVAGTSFLIDLASGDRIAQAVAEALARAERGLAEFMSERVVSRSVDARTEDTSSAAAGNRARRNEPTDRMWLRPALLLVALTIVFFVAFHPHWNILTGERNEFPVHLDEYVHWGYAKQTIAQGIVTFGSPFSNSAASSFNPVSDVHERGYQAYLGTFQAVTGIPWIDIFEFGPALIAVFLALCLYALTERWGAGVESALWVAAIPTTLRFLGPGFLVPIALALALVAVGLCIMAHAPGARGIAALVIVSAALWPIHLMGGLALLVLAIAFGVARMMRGQAGLFIVLFTTIPALVAIPYAISSFASGLIYDNPLPLVPGVLREFGVVPLLAAGVGAFVLLSARPERRRDVGWAAAIGLVAAEAVFLVGNASGLDFIMAYDRSFLILCLLSSILAGVAVAALRKGVLRIPLLHRPVLMVGIAVVLFAAQAGVVAMSAEQQLKQDYYRPLTPAQYASYIAASAELGGTNATAIVDGISTMAFTDVTGHPTSFQLSPSDTTQPADAREFFAGRSSDTAYLMSHRISIVVTQAVVENPDLREVAPGVYVLRNDYVEGMFR